MRLLLPSVASYTILTTMFTDTASHKSTKTADQPAHASRSATSTRASAPSSNRDNASTNRADLPFASLLHRLHPLPISLTSNVFFLQHTGRHRQHWRRRVFFPSRRPRARVRKEVHNDSAEAGLKRGVPALREFNWRILCFFLREEGFSLLFARSTRLFLNLWILANF